MSRTVFCRKYREELPGLDMPPLPGSRGQDIYDNVSRKAWEEWQSQQTRLINEKHLNMLEPETRAYLMTQMERFFNNEETDTAQGYVPPEQ